MEFLLEGILSLTWQQVVMYCVGILLIWLAIKKEYEPSLLLPMGFGAILVNLPLSGVLNQTLISLCLLSLIYAVCSEIRFARRAKARLVVRQKETTHA